MTYAGELKRAMEWLAEQPNVLFLGQGVADGGTHMAASFRDVPAEQKIEFPVAEELQTGASIGLALEGYLPVSVYPRYNFLLSAFNQLVNHLDRLPLLGVPVKVLIRVGVGGRQPLDPGPQHADDCTAGLRKLLKTVRVYEVGGGPEYDGKDTLHLYQSASADGNSVIVVEDAEKCSR